jgi:hypothetical protein
MLQKGIERGFDSFKTLIALAQPLAGNKSEPSKRRTKKRKPKCAASDFRGNARRFNYKP